ncbi:type II toxin-antitoxin system PemK/MazF family toxin [Zhihengliuella flava]|uniref:Type II toxin-antitoxin system PemK/MazF family toxin n=1 Tax=Zhihengliuella flava TaxID=1285193 RepID=A0A931D6K1_9MICC|nr:type II toxin-antitoxin system PemK/MazF family toxin [Zhihengliuella flava]MBG6083349.1 hypothetical protein [Zhihengliuella flava]
MRFNVSYVRRAMRLLSRIMREANKAGQRSDSRRRHRPDSVRGGLGRGSWEEGGYPGDFTGRVRPEYSPRADRRPDPGEIVWAWVPFEEDFGQGKDRPVLLVGRDRGYLLGLMLTSRDRNNAHASDPRYVDIGSGAWDQQGRDSEVKLDRVIRLLPEGVRREGAILGRKEFQVVADRLSHVR